MIDCMINNPIDIFYLTGVALSKGILLVLKDKKYLIVDSRYYETAKNKASDFEVIKATDFYNEYMTILDREKIKRLELDGNTVFANDFEAIKGYMPLIKLSCKKELGETLNNMRMIKSPPEIKQIMNAQRLTEKAFEHTLPFIKKGVPECEIAAEIDMFVRKNGGYPAFQTIVISGKNSSLPHGEPSQKLLEDGDFVVIDFGAQLEHYCSDMTRTVGIGHLSDRQINVYETVLEAQKKALEKIRPGQLCKDIDKAARKFIDKTEFKGTFEHGLGHGVGLQVHEQPNFNTRCETILVPGMVLTVEPGIYLEGEFGVRIEDMIIVTENGHENITTVNKELLIL